MWNSTVNEGVTFKIQISSLSNFNVEQPLPLKVISRLLTHFSTRIDTPHYCQASNRETSYHFSKSKAESLKLLLTSQSSQCNKRKIETVFSQVKAAAVSLRVTTTCPPAKPWDLFQSACKSLLFPQDLLLTYWANGTRLPVQWHPFPSFSSQL